MVAAKLFNSSVLVSSNGYLHIISGFIAGSIEHSSCPHEEGNDWLFSITWPSFLGKDAMKNPSQNDSLPISCSFLFSDFNFDKYLS